MQLWQSLLPKKFLVNSDWIPSILIGQLGIWLYSNQNRWGRVKSSLESLSLLEIVGRLGSSSQDGSQKVVTLGGQKPLVSNSLSSQSYLPTHLVTISRSLVTIEESSKVGGKAGARTKP
jgi:hypothetical protein